MQLALKHLGHEDTVSPEQLAALYESDETFHEAVNALVKASPQ